MIRFLQMLTTLVVFVVVMTLLGWAIRGGVDRSYPWVLAHIGHAGFFAIMGLVIAVGAWATYRSSKLGEGR
jgi:hypothetical protein